MVEISGFSNSCITLNKYSSAKWAMGSDVGFLGVSANRALCFNYYSGSAWGKKAELDTSGNYSVVGTLKTAAASNGAGAWKLGKLTSGGCTLVTLADVIAYLKSTPDTIKVVVEGTEYDIPVVTPSWC